MLCALRLRFRCNLILILSQRNVGFAFSPFQTSHMSVHFIRWLASDFEKGEEVK